MSQSQAGVDISLVAAVDLSSLQYRAVKQHTTAGQVTKCGAGEAAIGILQNAPAAGEAALVRISGTSKVYAYNGFTAGDALASADANGALDTVGAAPTSIIGYALATASKAGVLAEMLITHSYVPSTIAPASLTAACLYVVRHAIFVPGDITASYPSSGVLRLGTAHAAGTIIKAGFALDNMGTDGSNPLSIALDIQIGSTTIYTTPPALDKTATDGDDTYGSGTGVTVGVINTAADDVVAGDAINFALTLTRTASPSDEMADALVECYVQHKVGTVS
jgi:hypothetical protein